MNAHRFFAALVGILVPIAGFAHASGQTFERETDEYLIDIGYDTPFQVEEETLIDFGLFTHRDGEPDALANFTNLTLTIHSGSTMLYERSIEKPEFGKVFATVTPKRAGNWILTADFAVGDALVESASFDITIAPAIDNPSDGISDAFVFVVIIAMLIIASVFIFKRPRRLFS